MTPQGCFATPKIQCDEKNDFFSALQVLASRGDSREIMPGRRHVALRFPLPAVEVSETATSEPSVIRLIALWPTTPRPSTADPAHLFLYSIFRSAPALRKSLRPEPATKPFNNFAYDEKFALIAIGGFLHGDSIGPDPDGQGPRHRREQRSGHRCDRCRQGPPDNRHFDRCQGRIRTSGSPDPRGGGNFRSRTSATRPKTSILRLM